MKHGGRRGSEKPRAGLLDAGVVLVVWPQPFGDDISMSRDQLIDWYGRSFGFQVIQPDPVLMARMPGSTPRMLKLNPTVEAIHS